MTITHDECRDSVAGGSPVDAVTEAHLAGCSGCRAFAAAVADLDRRAAAVAPKSAPRGLADRVVAALPLDASPARPTWPGRTRAVVAVAAAVLLVAGVASSVVLRNREDAPRTVLLAAASHLEEEGASEVIVDAVTDVEIPANGRDPDFSVAPPEVRDHMAEQWNLIMAELDRRLAELDQRIDEMLSRVPGAPPPPPRERFRPTPSEGPAETPPAAPEAASLSIRIRAAGAVDPAVGLQLEGAVVAVPGSIEVRESTAAFAIDAARQGSAALRAPDGTWVETQAGPGPLGRVLVDPRALPSILRAAEGAVLARSTVLVGDGERGRRYTFRVPASAVGGGTEPWTGSAVIDDARRVRQLSLSPRPSGQPAPTRTRLTVDIGGRAALDASRSPAQVGARAVSDTSSPFAAVSPAVRAAVEGSTR
ncbi:MAG TPA: hypothetical protein VM345_10445 [Acidimicrobiales bacterium]|jgi:hypothetical protein|nr:hypothetical protein [Acidimicrobiales bacterium]